MRPYREVSPKMSQGSLAFRYARAWIELAEQAKCVTQVSEDLARIEAILLKEPKLVTLFSDTTVSKGERLQLLSQILGHVSASDLVARFMRFLIERERFASFSEMQRAYEKLCDERSGIVRASVTSVIPLGPDLAGQIEALLSKKTGKRVIVEYQQDPALIGGMVIQLGSRVYDGSVSGELRRAQELMLKGD